MRIQTGSRGTTRLPENVACGDSLCELRREALALGTARLSRQLYFAALRGGADKSGNRFGSPRAPRTSNSSNSSEGATTEAGNPPWAAPNAPSAVPEKPAI